MTHNTNFSLTSIGDQPNTDVGPVISKSAQERVERLIQSGIDEGAQVIIFLYFIVLFNTLEA